MADSINRIMPAAVAPERVAVTRRERDDNGRRGAQGRKREPADSVPAKRAQEGAAEAAPKDQPKGKRLNISA